MKIEKWDEINGASHDAAEKNGRNSNGEICFDD